MPRVGRAGAENVYEIGTPGNERGSKLFDFSTPAGWTMLWWSLAILLIVGMYLSL